MGGPYKVHMAKSGQPAITACGLQIEQHHARTFSGRANRLPLAARPDQVTCSNCVTIYYERHGAQVKVKP